MKKPLVSVVMSVYNSEKWLSYSIESIIEQTYTNFEFIIINDGSTDNSIKKIEKFIIKNKKKNIIYKIIILKKNKGKGEALKRGILASKSDWILTTDTDISVSLQQVITWIKKGFINKTNEIYFGSRNLRNSQT